MIGRLQRLSRVLYRDLWLRRSPSGLVSWRYCLPRPDQRVSLHRQWWWKNLSRWPRWAWLLREGWLWLRWVSWFGWWSSWRVLQRCGPKVKERESISLWTQGWRLIQLSLGCCVSPQDVYRFRLYRDPHRVWDYVLTGEVHGFHHWKSQILAGPQLDTDQPWRSAHAARLLLSDKVQFSACLNAIGVPVASILACVPKGNDKPLSTWLEDGIRLFCKMRSGNAGRGAFAVWQDSGVLSGETFAGTILPDEAAVIQAWQRLLKLDDGLVMPYLPNHPQLAPLAAENVTITIRFISTLEQGTPLCLSTTLEIPMTKHEKTGKQRYLILPIESKTGCVQPYPERLSLNPEIRTYYNQISQYLPEDFTIPDWSILVASSFKAHQQFSALWAIAWDWVITPTGPVLLEGNSGWGTTTPQMLEGGFVARMVS